MNKIQGICDYCGEDKCSEFEWIAGAFSMCKECSEKDLEELSKKALISYKTFLFFWDELDLPDNQYPGFIGVIARNEKEAKGIIEKDLEFNHYLNALIYAPQILSTNDNKTRIWIHG